MKKRYKLLIIVIMIMVVIIGIYILIFTAYQLNNHNKYIENIEKLEYYNAYDEEIYPKKNPFISKKELNSMDEDLQELEDKYSDSYLTIDSENDEEVNNLSLYTNLKYLTISCDANDNINV